MEPSLQLRVAQVLSLYAKHTKLPPYPESQDGQLFAAGSQVLIDGREVESNFDKTDLVMMGSTTKIFVMHVLAQLMHAQGIGQEQKVFPFTKAMLKEALWRGQYSYLVADPVYAGILQQLDFTPAEQQLLLQNDMDLRRQIQSGERIKWRELEDLPEVMLTLEQMCHHVLTSSANNAFAVAKKYAEMLAGDFESLQQLVYEIAPTMELTRTTENYAHWFQKGPNTGYLTKLTAAFDVLVATYLQDRQADEYRATIWQAVSNNTAYTVNFNLAASDLGKELIAKGYLILEKTGDYPCVIWIENLARAGYPPHLVMVDIVTVVTPGSKRITVGQMMAFEVPLPAELTREGFPNEAAEGYQEFLDGLMEKYMPVFRADLLEKFHRLVQTD